MARSINVPRPILSLDRYREIYHIPKWLFNGVTGSGENVQSCDSFWVQSRREEIAMALEWAADELSKILNYTLAYVYQEDKYKEWTNPLLLDWGYAIGGGFRSRTEVTPSASDFTTDPASITVPQSAFESDNEVEVVETETDIPLTIYEVEESGTDYIIYIEQCSLLSWDVLENQSESIEYDDTFPAASWLKLADLTVYRSYRDISDVGTIHYVPTPAYSEGCDTDTQTGCMRILKDRISSVHIETATYDEDDNSWTPASASCGSWERAYVNIKYLAGKLASDVPGGERSLTRLAHNNIVLKPCGCTWLDETWKMDTRIPEIVTGERVNCPFGMSDGAWLAWQWAISNKIGDAMVLL